MLNPAIKLGTSTPKADPSGDFAFALFAKAEAVKTGAKAALEAKALTLTGGPALESAPAGRNLYAWVMESGKGDIFLTYCTNALLAKAEVPALSIVAIPKSFNVGADYGARRRPRMIWPPSSAPKSARQHPARTDSVQEISRRMQAMIDRRTFALAAASTLVMPHQARATRQVTDSAGRKVELPDRIG